MTKTMKKIISTITMFAMIIAALSFTACSSGGDDDGGKGSGGSGDLGKNNTTDLSVTGGVKSTGMTYAEVTCYANISSEWENSARLNNLKFRVGVMYGESEHSLTEIEYGYMNGRSYNVILRNLKSQKTYYYKSFVEWGNSGIIGNEYWESFDILETGKTVSFTTKAVEYNGKMTTGAATGVTFFNASISANIDVSTLNANETYIKGIVYSTNKSALSGQLAPKLAQAYTEAASYDIIQPVSGGYYGNYVNGDLHFAINDNHQLDITMEPGNTVYYCPFVIISDKSFVGDIKQVTLRDLAVKTGLVDLGLSCLWAATNLDATSPWEMGGNYKENNALSKIKNQYGSDAHFPSKEQVEELNKCTLEEIDNGVLVTGPNGKQIFIPGTPRTSSYSFYDNYRYMTSSGESEYIGSGKYGYQQIYNIFFQYSSSSKAFSTYKGNVPYYDSSTYGSNKYSYQYCYARPVKGGDSRDGGGDNGGDNGGGGASAPSCPDAYHPHSIDLGLPSGKKWACCNVGAYNPEDYGNFYAWGEIVTKSKYIISTYQWSRGTNESLTKYNNDSSYGYVDNKTVLENADDAAYYVWGSRWHIPTSDEWKELIDNCTWSWITYSGVNGALFTSKDGNNSIFIPASGSKDDIYHDNKGILSHCWASNINTYMSFCAFFFHSSSKYPGVSNDYRYLGRPIRPIAR